MVAVELREYKFLYRLNISHSFNMNNINKGRHSHTIDICLYFKEKANSSQTGKKEEFSSYSDIELVIEEYFQEYNGRFINEISPFNTEMPTVERMGEFFYEEISREFQTKELSLVRMEISETPARIYVVSDFLMTGKIVKESTRNEVKIASYIEQTTKYLDFYIKNADTDEPYEEEEVKEKEESCEEKCIEKDEIPEKKNRLKNWQYTLIACGISLGVGAIVWALLFLTGNYPLGEDVYIHLTKSDYLCRQFTNGYYFPETLSTWFGGYEMFGISAPIPIYMLALLQIVGGSVAYSYIIYIAVCATLSVFGWYLAASVNGNHFRGMIIGAVWLFVPGVNDFIFVKGDLPMALAIALVPYVIYSARKIIVNRRNIDVVLHLILLLAILFTDYSNAVLYLAGFFIIFIFMGISYRNVLGTIYVTVSQLLVAVFAWCYITFTIGPEFGDTFEGAFELCREGYVFIILALVCFFITAGHTKYAYMLSVTVALLVFLGDFAGFVGFPTGKYLFNGNYSVIMCALFALGLIEWQKGKKIAVSAVLVICALICIPNILTLVTWNSSESFYEKEMNLIKRNGVADAISKTKEKIYLADSEAETSFAAYYASNCGKTISFDFKLDEIKPPRKEIYKRMSDAVSAAQYTYFFDRVYEGGNDIIAVNKSDIISQSLDDRIKSNIETARIDFEEEPEQFYYDWIYNDKTDVVYEESDFIQQYDDSSDIEKLYDKQYKNIVKTVSEERWNEERDYSESAMMEAAHRFGYSLLSDKDMYFVFKNEDITGCDTSAEYKGIAIGNNSGMIARLFPYFEEGSVSLDDYSLEELRKYEKIFLLGTKWSSNEEAENIIRQLADSGVDVYMDMTNLPRDAFVGKTSMFGVTAQEVHFEKGYEYLLYGGQIYETSKFGGKDWDTVYLTGLEKPEGYSWLGGEKLPFYGKVYNDKVHVLAFDLIYYTVELQDNNAGHVLADIMGLTMNQTPERALVE